MLGNSSVGQFATKVHKNREQNEVLTKWCNESEKMISDHINESVSQFQNRFKNINRLLSLVIDTAFEMQSEHGDVNLKVTNTKQSGIWMSTVALNAQTSQFHSEQDCTYTIVKVPCQSKVMNNDHKHQHMFLLKINEQKTIALPFIHNVSFFYSPTFLTHRQHCDEQCNSDGSIFYNIVCYGNKRLYSHLKQLFVRNKKK